MDVNTSNGPPAANEIAVNSYYTFGFGQHYDSLSTPSQTEVRFARNQSLLGVDWQIGLNGFLVGDKVDRSRSGAFVRFNGQDFRDRLRGEHQQLFDSLRRAEVARMLAIDDEFRQATAYLEFERYNELLHDTRFSSLRERLAHVADSLQRIGTGRVAEVDSTLLADRQRLEAFVDQYDDRLNEVRDISGDVKARSRAIKSRGEAMADKAAERQLHHRVLGNNVVKKLIAQSRRIGLGNTHLPERDELSVGLPIRGISYAYAADRFEISAAHGRRIRSDFFTPQRGFAVHDAVTGTRFTQLGAEVQDGRGSKYTLTGIAAKERPGPVVNDVRTNRVVAIRTEQNLSSGLSLLLGWSYGGTNRAAGTDLVIGSGINQDNTAYRAGLAWRKEKGSIQISAFRRGAQFASWGNPYLLTDVGGLDGTLDASLLNGKLDVRASFEVGRGTTAGTEGRTRYQAQGHLRYRVSPTTYLSAVAAPNVYQLGGEAEDQRAESTLYRFDFVRRGQRMHWNISATNLDVGYSWNDTTTVSQRRFVMADLYYSVTEKSTVGFLTRQGLPAADTPGKPEYLIETSFRHRGSLDWRVSILYGRQRPGAAVGGGGTLACAFPLGKFGSFSTQLFYQSGAGPAADAISTPPLTNGYSSLQSSF